MDLKDWFNTRACQHDLRTGHGRPLRMVDQSELSPQEAYEAFIARTGGLPTRDNLHDRFNALVWLHLPQFKASLNALQANEIAVSGHRNNVRGPWRDWATVLDENGFVVVASAQGSILREYWEAHNWRAMFLDSRASWSRWPGGLLKDESAVQPSSSESADDSDDSWQAWPLGHALLEKAQQPFKGITGHAWLIEAFVRTWAELDQQSSRELERQRGLDGRPPSLFPLPMMGMPGWTDDNDSPDFYEDSNVFRPTRRDMLRG